MTSSIRCDSLDASAATMPATGPSTASIMQVSESTPGESSPNTPQDNIDNGDEDLTPSKRTGLRRKREEPMEPEPDPMGAAMKPLTDEERRAWPGWVELESEPVRPPSSHLLLRC